MNPDIVYVSVSGFGQTGPYRARAGVNLTVEAFSGVLSITGEPDGKPMRPGVQTADMFGALFGTYAVLSGLVNVLRNRGGRVADVSMVEASLAVAAWETAGYLATGEVPQRLGDHHRLNAPYSLFETRDGRWIAFSGAREHFFRRIMKVLGLEAGGGGSAVRQVVPAQAERDRAARRDVARHQEMGGATARDGADGSRRPVLARERLPAGVRRSARARARRACRSRASAHGSTENGAQSGALRPGGPEITRPAPLLGEHSAEILRELGYTAQRIEALTTSGIVGGAVGRTRRHGRDASSITEKDSQ